jgi:DNA-directed RNA polymerase specialized sigma24 family protein
MNFGTEEQQQTAIKEAKKKANKEFRLIQERKNKPFDKDFLEVFLTRHALKEVHNWNTKVIRKNWEDNFLKYIRQALKLDFLDFINSEKNVLPFGYSLDDDSKNNDGSTYELSNRLEVSHWDNYDFGEDLIEKLDLTERRKEVFRLMEKGYKAKEIALIVGVHVNTITADRKVVAEAIKKIANKGEMTTMNTVQLKKIGKRDMSIKKDTSLKGCYERAYVNSKPDYSQYCNVGNTNPFANENNYNAEISKSGGVNGIKAESEIHIGQIVGKRIVWDHATFEEYPAKRTFKKHEEKDLPTTRG